MPHPSTPDPLAQEAITAIRQGDVETLQRLLEQHPALATTYLDGARTPLHVVTDFPGHFPRGAETVRTLVAAGADVNAPFVGRHRETPLHWAASCDDVAVLDALLDAGADLEAPGSVINGEFPLADAVAFGQWNAARRLVERGARANLWEAAALGLMERVEEFFAAPAVPEPAAVTSAFWCACHGGQRVAADYLLQQGADLNWVGYDGLTPLDAARRSKADELAASLISRGANSAKQA